MLRLDAVAHLDVAHLDAPTGGFCMYFRGGHGEQSAAHAGARAHETIVVGRPRADRGKTHKNNTSSRKAVPESAGCGKT